MYFQVDCETVLIMDDDTLKSFFPALGDRLAVKSFCQKSLKKPQKQSLLEKLKRKINTKNNVGADQAGPSTSKPSNDGQTPSAAKKPHKNQKQTRFIQIGWLVEENQNQRKQVRAKLGGGCRKIEISKQATKEDILQRAISIFFDYGNAVGKRENFTFDIVDFKHNVIEDDLTVGEMYALTGLSVLRFYLVSTKKTEEVQGRGLAGVADAEMRKNDEEFQVEDERDFEENPGTGNAEAMAMEAEVDLVSWCNDNVWREEIVFHSDMHFLLAEDSEVVPHEAQSVVTDDQLQSSPGTLVYNFFYIYHYTWY